MRRLANIQILYNERRQDLRAKSRSSFFPSRFSFCVMAGRGSIPEILCLDNLVIEHTHTCTRASLVHNGSPKTRTENFSQTGIIGFLTDLRVSTMVSVVRDPGFFRGSSYLS